MAGAGTGLRQWVQAQLGSALNIRFGAGKLSTSPSFGSLSFITPNPFPQNGAAEIWEGEGEMHRGGTAVHEGGPIHVPKH